MNYFTTIKRQIASFLDDVVEREHIDLIVCSERKATATLRMLISDVSRPCKFVWEWSKVLSIVAVPQFDWASFKGSKVLFFDELVHHGKTLRRDEIDLRNHLPSNIDIVTAGFAVWDQCEYKPQFSFYSAVDSETYEAIRGSIIYILQKHGSLLLDTEHIELSVRINCGIREFYDELARATEDGRTYSFVSGAGQTNLTVDQPDIVCEEAIRQILTPGSNMDGTVRKIRVLERTREIFSILPIFYPNVRCVLYAEWTKNLPQFIWKDHLSNTILEKEVFYIVALLCSIELLRSIVVALNDLIVEGKVILEVPKENFSHLHAMFPRIDGERLLKYVYDVIADSKKTKAKRSRKAVRARNVPTDKLLKLSSRVMYSLVEKYDNMPLDSDLPKDKSWKELLEIVEIQNYEGDLDIRALTVVVDRLIDSGLVVTNAKRVRSSSGEPYFIRTFTPEGEVVSSKIRQQMMVRVI